MTSDLAYANDVRAARERQVPRAAAALIAVLAVMIAAFVVWSRHAVIEEVTRGEGQVVPAQQIQTVQSLEGGIVAEILVREGERVEQGHVLVRLDRTSTGSRLGELAGQRHARLARIARLTAEAEGLPAPQFPEELRRAAPDLIAAETELFEAELETLERQRAVLAPQLEQRREELRELEERKRKLVASKELLDRELELKRRLSRQRAVPEIELIQLERQAVEANGELDEIEPRRKRIEAGIAEYENRLASAESDFRTKARSELAKEVGELRVIGESITGAADRVERTVIRAPVKGIVNRIAVTTIGGVIAPGGAVLELVPLDDRLVVEARIRPQDVAFIRAGQPASVKLSAYDFTIYGSLRGEVTQVGANTIADQKTGEPFYRVVVETGEAALTHGGRALDIIPGMVATVEIETGSKTIFDYLVGPVSRLAAEALRER